MSPALPRGECPTCGASVSLRVGDLIREHRDQRKDGIGKVAPLCVGSGKKAKRRLSSPGMI